MDFTMLRQICRRGRLTGFIQDYVNTDGPFGAALKILFPGAIVASTEKAATNHEAEHNSRGVALSAELYGTVLKHVNTLWPNSPFRHRNDLPHPPNAHVLPPVAVPVKHITHNGRNYSIFSMHPGGSSVSYRCQDGTIDVGFIMSMWTQVLMGVSHLYIVVSPHAHLTANDAARSPYVSRPGFMGTVVYSKPTPTQERKHVLIEQKQIRGHVAYYERPPGTFGIKSGIRILVDSLHRNRE
jgi:hypothetical protein